MGTEIADGLFQFEWAAKGMLWYSYLWVGPGGNILFNHIPDVGFWKKQMAELRKLGGVRWVYMTHSGDADAGSTLMHAAFGTELAGTEQGGEKAVKKCKVPIGKVLPFEVTSEKGLKCIPAPGHADFFFVFLIKAGKRRCLFTSDMFHQAAQDVWKVKIPERRALVGLESIGRMFEEKVDLLLPGLSGAAVRGPYALDAKGRPVLRERLEGALRKKYKMAKV